MPTQPASIWSAQRRAAFDCCEFVKIGMYTYSGVARVFGAEATNAPLPRRKCALPTLKIATFVY